MYYCISDIHLGFNDKPEKQGALTELFNEIDHVGANCILLGDTFDFWRRNDTEILNFNEQVLLHIPKGTVFIKGNHDFTHKLAVPYHVGYADNNPIFFSHGYEYDVYCNYESLGLQQYERWCEHLCRCGNKLGSSLSFLWTVKNNIPSLNKIRKGQSDIDKIEYFVENPCSYMYTGVPEQSYVLYGHTHRRYMGKISTNVGSFCDCGDYTVIEDNGSIRQHQICF